MHASLSYLIMSSFFSQEHRNTSLETEWRWKYKVERELDLKLVYNQAVWMKWRLSSVSSPLPAQQVLTQEQNLSHSNYTTVAFLVVLFQVITSRNNISGPDVLFNHSSPFSFVKVVVTKIGWWVQNKYKALTWILREQLFYYLSFSAVIFSSFDASESMSSGNFDLRAFMLPANILNLFYEIHFRG